MKIDQIRRMLPPSLAGKRAAAKAARLIAANGLVYPEVMGKFQHEMANLPPRLWLLLVDLCVMRPLTDASAAEVDRLIEEIRCSACGQVGRACTCEVK